MGGLSSIIKTINIVVGLIFLVWGAVVIISFFNIQMPYFPEFVQTSLTMPIVLKIALLGVAVLDLLSAFSLREPPMFVAMDWGGMLVSIIVAAVAVFPLLLSYGIIGQYLPINLQFEIPVVALGGLMAFYGLKCLGNFYKIYRMKLVLGY